MKNYVAPFAQGHTYATINDVPLLPYGLKFSLTACCPKCSHDCNIGSLSDDSGLFLRCQNCDFEDIRKGVTAKQLADAMVVKLDEARRVFGNGK